MNLIPTIQLKTDIENIAVILAVEQMDYWYDPCGKSGFRIEEILTPNSIACIKRIIELKKLGGV